MTTEEETMDYPILRENLRRYAQQVGAALENTYPAENRAIPNYAVDEISEHLTGFIAEVLQTWLDAGSERDVTLENLYDPIRREVASWSVDAVEGK
jgi:hypothetical protein